MKKVLLVGNCDYDGPRMKSIIEEAFSVEVLDIKTIEEAISLLEKESVALVLVNRIGAFDSKNGLELIDFMHENHAKTPCMMLTNYPDKMQEAVEHGAIEGFGKQKILPEEREESLTILKKYI